MMNAHQMHTKEWCWVTAGYLRAHSGPSLGGFACVGVFVCWESLIPGLGLHE